VFYHSLLSDNGFSYIYTEQFFTIECILRLVPTLMHLLACIVLNVLSPLQVCFCNDV